MGWLRERRAEKDELEHHLDALDEGQVTNEKWLNDLGKQFPEVQPEEPTGDTLAQVFDNFALETGVDPLPFEEGIGRVQRMPAKWEEINHCEQCGTITPGPICLNCSADAAAEAAAEDDQLERERGLCDDQD